MSLQGEVSRSLYDQLLRQERECFAALDLRNPRIDKVAVEKAVNEYLSVCGAAARPMRWVADIKGARRYPLIFVNPAYVPLGSAREWSFIEAALEAGAGVRLQAPWSRMWWALWDHYHERLLSDDDGRRMPVRFAEIGRQRRENAVLATSTQQEALAEVAAPLLKAFVAGLFLLKIERKEVVCVPRPSLWVADGRLHREDGPALSWRTGEGRYFWRGVRVPSYVVERPNTITPLMIRSQRNAEVCRCMIERFGFERYVREANPSLVSKDLCGVLWQFELGPTERHAVLEVENGTLERDGTRRRYFLEVPPWMESPHMAVAWTYGLSADQYDIAVRT